jgi:hypothetical protein
MIYEKFPVVFLSMTASEKSGSTNRVIADYILEHQEEVSRMGIKQLAELCHVGTGSVSRFCRDYGLEDFSQLKRMLKECRFSYEPAADSPDALFPVFEEEMKKTVTRTVSSVDMDKVRQLCADIRKYEKISAYGMLKGESAAISLQTDLLMMHKRIDTALAYTEQLSRILQAGRDELIIIFSYTGSYFEYHRFGADERKLVLPKIWMICGTERELPWFVNDAIRFASDGSQRSHPFQLEAAESLIVQEYARLFPGKDL